MLWRYVALLASALCTLVRARTPSCLVVGAGPAGLSCARALLSHGVDARVLEASSRVGGRVRTQHLSAHGLCELGTTWMHGTAGNRAWELACEFGLLEESSSSAGAAMDRAYALADELWLRDDGRAVDMAAVAAARRVFQEAISTCEDGDAGTASVGEHVLAAWARELDELVVTHGDADLLSAILQWEWRMQCMVDGCACLNDEGAAAFAQYADVPGPDLRMPLGFSSLTDRLAQPLLEAGRLQLESPVLSVYWGTSTSKTDPGSEPPSGSGAVRVQLASGEWRAADAVVLSVPLPALNRIAIEPPPPQAHMQARQQLELGAVEKLFVRLERCSDAGGSDAPPPKLIKLLWLCPDDERWAVADTSTRVGDVGTRTSWARSLNRLRWEAGMHPHSVVGWLTGDHARAAARLSDTELKQELTQELRPFWDQLGWQPASATCTTFSADPFIGGAYTFPRVGALAPGVAEALASPLYAHGDCTSGAAGKPAAPPSVLFCGEATSAEHFGTVHGAIASGEREATRLLASWGLL